MKKAAYIEEWLDGGDVKYVKVMTFINGPMRGRMELELCDLRRPKRKIFLGDRGVRELRDILNALPDLIKEAEVEPPLLEQPQKLIEQPKEQETKALSPPAKENE